MSGKELNILKKYKDKVIMCQFLMYHLINNVILTMSYMLVLELDTISVSYLTTNVAKLRIRWEF